ncbi:unnamed protein product [Rhizophagus irregularis]|nr:unnamed protein product [Rhizophagus irregularis]
MLKYVDYFNDIRSKNGTRRNPAMLVYDSFKGHLEGSVKKKFHESRFDLAVIPGSLTSICQPLDVSINKPFKDNLRKEWHTWMASGGAGETAAGNLRRARLSDVCLWVKRAWDAIHDETVIESFKTCKISTDLNGLDSELEISDDDDESNVDDDDGNNVDNEGSDDASDNGNDDNSIHDSNDSKDVSDRMRQLTV